jgi:fluoride exporter
MLRLLFIIGSGSFIGGIARFLISRYIQGQALSSFPYGTFLVNVAGCFLIGIFYGLSERGNLMNSDLRMFLTVGFCGGFTTFSTFASENISLLREGDFFYFAIYTSLSIFLGLMATYIGNLIIKAL